MQAMKKYILPFFIVFLSLGFILFNYNKSNKTSIIPSDQQTNYETKAILIIDFGNKETKEFEVATTPEDTAYSILKTTLTKENINLEVQQYDFGVFVKKIAEFESGADKSWIYYVNQESGQIAADQHKLESGDRVDWKYETPKY